MPAQEKLSPIEQYMAYIAGAGIALVILALLLIGLGTADDNLTISLLIVGVVVLALGVGGWLYFMRPWKQFDDLKTPHYTGHAAHAPAAAPSAEPVAAAVEAAAPVKAEVAAPAAEAPKPDDLTLIEGIGPKSAAALAASGVTTFAQVAALTAEALEAMVKGQKVRLVGSTTSWPTQARLAAAGELTALEDLQRRIKSGGKVYDDLTKIEGVGPKAQEALYQAGLLTYQDVAAVAPDTLRLILAGAGLTSLNPERWSEQAALAAGHDLTGLKKLQDEL